MLEFLRYLVLMGGPVPVSTYHVEVVTRDDCTILTRDGSTVMARQA